MLCQKTPNIKLYLTILLGLLITSCTSTNKNLSSIGLNKDYSSSSIKQKLARQHQAWKGAPYRLGGLKKSGVDCSGFVMLTYQQQFGKLLPRTTKEQAKLGKKIDKDHLKAGDLVFFKTSYKVRHVGIYLDNDTFLHASTSKGVMISSLHNPYWKKHYWQARRP